MKAILFGVGATAKAVAKYADEKGIEIVGAFSRSTGHGEDVGSVLELGRELGMAVGLPPEKAAGLPKADVALIATQTGVASQDALVRLALAAGMDVLSLAEEGFFPLSGSKAALDGLHAAAIASGKSVFFGGVQDVFWYQSLLSLTGASQSIEAIEGVSLSNLEDLGEATMRQYPLGLTPKDFESGQSQMEESESGFVIVEPVIEAIVKTLGLEVVDRNLTVQPIYAENKLEVPLISKVIWPGQTCGIMECLTATASAGFKLEMKFGSKIMADGETASVKWLVRGTPDLQYESANFPGYEVTAAALVNRIPQVISASPGYKSVIDLPPALWWAGANARSSRGGV